MAERATFIETDHVLLDHSDNVTNSSDAIVSESTDDHVDYVKNSDQHEGSDSDVTASDLVDSVSEDDLHPVKGQASETGTGDNDLEVTFTPNVINKDDHEGVPLSGTVSSVTVDGLMPVKDQVSDAGTVDSDAVNMIIPAVKDVHDHEIMDKNSPVAISEGINTVTDHVVSNNTVRGESVAGGDHDDSTVAYDPPKWFVRVTVIEPPEIMVYVNDKLVKPVEASIIIQAPPPVIQPEDHPESYVVPIGDSYPKPVVEKEVKIGGGFVKVDTPVDYSDDDLNLAKRATWRDHTRRDSSYLWDSGVPMEVIDHREAPVSPESHSDGSREMILEVVSSVLLGRDLS